MQQGTADQEPPRAEVVEEQADPWRHEQHEEDLGRDDPADGARAVFAQRARLVVVLEDADCVDPAEGDEEAG